MSIIEEKIRLESDNSLSFGNYLVSEKQKVDNFAVGGDIYKIKTYNVITKLEKNSNLLFESVPGSCVHNFKLTEDTVSFKIEGFEDTQITLELEPETEYKIFIDDVNVGSTKSNLSGKINFSVALNKGEQAVVIKKH